MDTTGHITLRLITTGPPITAIHITDIMAHLPSPSVSVLAEATEEVGMAAMVVMAVMDITADTDKIPSRSRKTPSPLSERRGRGTHNHRIFDEFDIQMFQINFTNANKR